MSAFLFGTVLCVGDSLTFGARSPLGFPEHLGPMLTARSPAASPVEWVAINRGVSGETTRQILDRTPSAVASIAASAGPKWFVLLAGTNDSKGGGLPLDEWEALYRQALHWPRRYAIPIAVCTFPPVLPGQMPAYTKHSVAWLREASARVRAIAGELDCNPSPIRLVDLERAITEADLCDGVHLLPSGYRKMAVLIAEALASDDKPASQPAPARPRVKAKRITASTQD